MKKIISASGNYLMGIEQDADLDLSWHTQFDKYCVILAGSSEGIFHVNYFSFELSGA